MLQVSCFNSRVQRKKEPGEGMLEVEGGGRAMATSGSPIASGSPGFLPECSPDFPAVSFPLCFHKHV